MRLLAFAAFGSLLITSMGGAEMERALSLSRARDGERQQFHRRYLFDLPGPVVTQIEVVTPFRRLVLIGEDHVARGDSMFTRGLREAEAAIKPMRDLVTIRATLRFNPLNTFIESPPYSLALSGRTSDALEPIGTNLTPLFSNEFKTRDGKKLVSSLIGATLESTFDAALAGQAARTVAVTLEGKEVGHVLVDFSRLE
jgi:hypothetical protein